MGARTIGRLAGALLTVLCISPLHAVTLRWDITRDERLEIVKTAKVKLFVDQALRKEYDERNIVNLTCYERGDAGSRVRGDFSIFQRDSSDEVFKAGELLERHESDFLIAGNGRFTVKEGDYMPNLRHIPTFPGGDVPEGHVWKGEGELHFNGFSRPFSVSFPVEYRFEGMGKERGVDCAVIRYAFRFDRRMPRGIPQDMPLRVTGMDEGTLYWDTARNEPVNMKEMEDRYAVLLVFSPTAETGSLKFQMHITTVYRTYRPVAEEEKEKARRELEETIPKESGVDVVTDKRGLVVRLGDVLFDFDSYRLKEDSRGTLNRVADVIGSRYPDRELIVEGHTDSTGDVGYNQRLSEDRALAVARYMKSRVGHDKISYRGFGEKNPLADNGTAEGRQKNRRVDVIIRMK
ncbi:MAG: OmpA family protein [Spirochaetes bacterium]|nr:OmpA family protein [Spirochaetota bacterium]